MFNKNIIILNCFLGVVLTGLLFSALSMNTYPKEHQTAVNAIRSIERVEDRIVPCGQLHLPFLARTMSVFVPLALFLDFAVLVVLSINRARRMLTRGVLRWSVILGIIGFIGIIVVQLWEPDYWHLICSG